MPTLLSVGFAVLWLASLVPAVYLAVYRRRVPSAYWLVALGFMVSWWADAFNAVTDIPWLVTHYYPAAQVGLFGLAFGGWWVPLVAFALALFAGAISTGGPEIIVTLFGSIAVLWLSRNHELRHSMLAYCGAATVFYLILASEVMTAAFYPAWYSYSAMRVLAFALFLRTAYRWREA